MMLCEDDYEEDDGKDYNNGDYDEENMARPSFGLILLAHTAKSPGNI